MFSQPARGRICQPGVSVNLLEHALRDGRDSPVKVDLVPRADRLQQILPTPAPLSLPPRELRDELTESHHAAIHVRRLWNDGGGRKPA